MIKKAILAVICCFLCLGSLTACKDKDATKVVFTTGFGKDEVFRIDSAVCKKNEIMVYLSAIQSQYEEIYGKEVWNVANNGVTLEDNVKETVLARMAQIKTMSLLAEKNQLELDEKENERIQAAANEYFESLDLNEQRIIDVTYEDILAMYREYCLANKVYQFIIQDINPEISDDEARIVTVQHILFPTWVRDGSGDRVDYDDDLKKVTYQKACEVQRLATEQEADFAELAAKYSQEEGITFHYGKGDLDSVLEEIVFTLETNEISAVIENSQGYHIFKCLNTFDREETDANKLLIVEQKKRQVFGEEYDEFTNGLARQLNRKCWEEIGLLQNEEIQTSDFFEVYEKYFD